MNVYSPHELNSPSNDYTARLAASIVIPGNICVYGWTVSNTNAAAQYIFVFDANAVPGTGAIPAFWFSVAAAGDREFGYLPPREFNTGLVLANSSTNTSFTAGSADCLFDVQFDTLAQMPNSGGSANSAGLPLSGGTLTGELTVDTGAGTGQALELQGTRTTENDVFRIDYPHAVVVFDSDGVSSFTSDDAQELLVAGTGDTGAGLTVANNPTSFQAEVTADATHARCFVLDSNVAVIAALSTLLGLMTARTTVPADGNISAGQAAIWLDPTNGASKLMVKAKSANGTVVTGSLALA